MKMLVDNLCTYFVWGRLMIQRPYTPLSIIDVYIHSLFINNFRRGFKIILPCKMNNLYWRVYNDNTVFELIKVRFILDLLNSAGPDGVLASGSSHN